jgi:hypothetical protein
MAVDEAPKPDWIYLPNDVKEISLWSSLHDGELVSCSSDLFKYSVSLEFFVRHLLDEDEKSGKSTFKFNLENVTSVRAVAHFRPIVEFQEQEDQSAEARHEAIMEYQAKWREESFSWKEFEPALTTDPLLIYDANLVANNSESTLRLGGSLNGEKFDDIFFDVFIRANAYSLVNPKGHALSLEQFIDLGRNYWSELSSRDRG